MKYRIVRARSKDRDLYHAALARCDGKCEAVLPCIVSENAVSFARYCDKQPVQVCKLEDGTFICYCDTCRFIALGLSPGEKSAQTKARKLAQRTFWDEDA